MKVVVILKHQFFFQIEQNFYSINILKPWLQYKKRIIDITCIHLDAGYVFLFALHFKGIKAKSIAWF